MATTTFPQTWAARDIRSGCPLAGRRSPLHAGCIGCFATLVHWPRWPTRLAKTSTAACGACG
eukprot:5174304-Prorocentrum_lima.AAC.1